MANKARMSMKTKDEAEKGEKSRSRGVEELNGMKTRNDTKSKSQIGKRLLASQLLDFSTPELFRCALFVSKHLPKFMSSCTL